MKKIFTLLVLAPCFAGAQFVRQGVCTKSGNTFTLNGISQSPYAGRFFATAPVNLNNNFDLTFSAYLGNNFNNGMAFLFLPGAVPTATYPPTVISTDNIHNFGTGSIANDFVIEFDIRGSFCAAGQNTSYEPTTDVNHVSYWRNNSSCTFGNYYSPYSSLGTINYYAYEPYRIKWTKSTNTLETYYNNVLIKSNVVDLVGLLGANVYWGFSSGCYCVTGGPSIKNMALNGAVILPLTMLEFSGKTVNNNGVISWKTTDEDNTHSFDIERSTDGRNYTAAGTVAAVNQPGVHQYSFTDNNITAFGTRIVYYRLKQIDIDGHFTYSKIIALTTDNEGGLIILYPNPVINEANITITINRPERVVGRIMDNSGRIVKQQQWNIGAGSTSLTMDVKGLAKGFYSLELKGETINAKRQFVKQ